MLSSSSESIGKKAEEAKRPWKSRLDGREVEIKILVNKRVTNANIAKIIDVS
jgi:hypothetical protein